MFATLKPAKMPQKMIRIALVPAVLACALGLQVARAQDQDAYSDLENRVDRMQETIRDLTGQVEQLQYHNQRLEQEVQRLQQLVPGAAAAAGASASPPPPAQQYSTPQQYASPGYSPPPRYPTPAAGYAPPASPYQPPPQTAVSSQDGGRHDAFNPAADPNAPGVPHPLSSSTNMTEPPPPYQFPQANAGGQSQPGAPLNLSSVSTPQGGPGPGGQLPPPPPSDPDATGGMQASLSPSLPGPSSPKDEFALGRGYFERKDYAQAANTFRNFLHQYPNDRLSPEVQYWLGESLYDARQYHDAAEAFLTVSTKYQTNPRAPDALLRLGESLSAMGQKEAACASLGEVLRKYPRATLSVKESVARDQKRAHC